MRSFVVLMPVLMTISACGGSSDSEMTDKDTPTPREAFITRVADFGDLAEDIDALAPTATANIPTSGEATFSGAAEVFIDPVFETDADDVFMIGDLVLEVDFSGTGTVTGRADNFDAIVDDGEGRRGRIVAVDGHIDIGANASGIGQGRPTKEFETDYAGTLSVEDETYDVSGDIDGFFMGNRPARPEPETIIKGIFGQDTGLLSIDSDGDDAPGTIVIYAENPL